MSNSDFITIRRSDLARAIQAGITAAIKTLQVEHSTGTATATAVPTRKGKQLPSERDIQRQIERRRAGRK